MQKYKIFGTFGIVVANPLQINHFLHSGCSIWRTLVQLTSIAATCYAPRKNKKTENTENKFLFLPLPHALVSYIRLRKFQIGQKL